MSLSLNDTFTIVVDRKEGESARDFTERAAESMAEISRLAVEGEQSQPDRFVIENKVEEGRFSYTITVRGVIDPRLTGDTP